MNIEQAKVKQFMRQAKQSIPNRPMIPDQTIRLLRSALMTEELGELVTAMQEKNLEKTADGLADLLYVVYGTAIACGIDMEPIFAEVHRSNMTKFGDGTFREDGKYVKGPNYSPPDLMPLLRKMQPR